MGSNHLEFGIVFNSRILGAP